MDVLLENKCRVCDIVIKPGGRWKYCDEHREEGYYTRRKLWKKERPPVVKAEKQCKWENCETVISKQSTWCKEHLCERDNLNNKKYLEKLRQETTERFKNCKICNIKINPHRQYCEKHSKEIRAQNNKKYGLAPTIRKCIICDIIIDNMRVYCDICKANKEKLELIEGLEFLIKIAEKRFEKLKNNLTIKFVARPVKPIVEKAIRKCLKCDIEISNYQTYCAVHIIERKNERQRARWQVNKDKYKKPKVARKPQVKKVRTPEEIQKRSIRHSVSETIRAALKNKGASKCGKSITQYLDYTFDELFKYIENLFEPWMSWDNWGRYVKKTWNDNDQTTWKWQIDHIIPHSNFDYNFMGQEEFQKCWALENLRPYSAKQNVLESDRKNNKKMQMDIIKSDVSIKMEEIKGNI